MPEIAIHYFFGFAHMLIADHQVYQCVCVIRILMMEQRDQDIKGDLSIVLRKERKKRERMTKVMEGPPFLGPEEAAFQQL